MIRDVKHYNLNMYNFPKGIDFSGNCVIIDVIWDGFFILLKIGGFLVGFVLKSISNLHNKPFTAGG